MPPPIITISHLFHNKNTGKGSAIKSAQKYVKGKYIVTGSFRNNFGPKINLKDLINSLDTFQVLIN